MADVAVSSGTALDTVDRTPYLIEVRREHLGGALGLPGDDHGRSGQTRDREYSGVLAAADVFTPSTTFRVMQSLLLDLGYGSQVHLERGPGRVRHVECRDERLCRHPGPMPGRRLRLPEHWVLAGQSGA
jgi:hypothetical protein